MDETPFHELMENSVQLYRMFTALVEAGFSERQAMQFMAMLINSSGSTESE